MKGGRAKNGAVAVPWASVALARPHQRRTLRLRAWPPAEKERPETADPPVASLARGDAALSVCIHIRELNMLAGGLGCALWDGAVVLARWIAANPEALEGQTVMELGAGCGLPGIVAARVGASRVVLTEYIPELVRNLEYNIAINSKDESEQDDEDEDGAEDRAEDEEEQAQHRTARRTGRLQRRYPAWRRDLRPVASAAFLDWMQVPDPRAPAQDAPVVPAPPPAVCTRAAHGRGFRVQAWQTCLDCYPAQPDNGVCGPCAVACHKGHRLGPPQESRFRCDCGDGGSGGSALGPCQIGADGRTPPAMPGVTTSAAALPQQVDVLLGAEITYNTLSIDALANVVDAYLKPDGVFYETLSNDRDGVEAFVAEMQRRGFSVERREADRGYLGNYNTRDWSFQNLERYTFYTFSRPASTHPMMGSRTPIVNKVDGIV